MQLDATYLTNLMQSRQYESAEQIVEEALRHGESERMIIFFMQLRYGNVPGFDLMDVLAEAWARRGGRSGTRWTSRFAASLWTWYNSALAWARPTGAATDEQRNLQQLSGLSRRERQLVHGTGLVAARKPHLGKQSDKLLTMLLAMAELVPMVIWIDNYNKYKYSKNINRERNLSVNATAVAMLALPQTAAQGVPAFRGALCLKELLCAVQKLPSHLANAQNKLRGAIQSLVLLRLTYDEVRAPLDIRRYNVQIADWKCAHLLPANISDTTGLLQVARFLRNWQDKFRVPVQPVLADVDIYWRFMKMHYCVTHVTADTGAFLSKTALLFGMWHTYKFLALNIYRRFAPFLCSLEFPTFLTHPASVTTLKDPALIVVECVLLAGFLIKDFALTTIRCKHYDVVVTGRDPVAKERLQALRRLSKSTFPRFSSWAGVSGTSTGADTPWPLGHDQ